MVHLTQLVGMIHSNFHLAILDGHWPRETTVIRFSGYVFELRLSNLSFGGKKINQAQQLQLGKYPTYFFSF